MIGDTSTDKQGDAHFQVSQGAHSSFAMGGAVLGSIDNHVNLEVTPDQKVGIEAGSSARDFPSLEVFKYIMNDKGNITTTQILTKQESGDVDDLNKSEQPITAQTPK